MEQINLREGDAYIKLGQALKKAGMVSSGADATYVITDGQVTVNGEKEVRRGRKLYAGDVFEYGAARVTVSP